jgi:hypothetical protein
MRVAQTALSIAILVIGIALVARAAFMGLWPPSLQLIAGAGLLVFGTLKLRYT